MSDLEPDGGFSQVSVIGPKRHGRQEGRCQEMDIHIAQAQTHQTMIVDKLEHFFV